MSLDGRTALVTGASSGIGRATVEVLVARGARVIAAARRRERLDELAEHSASIRPLPMDIRDHTAVDAALASLPEDWRQVDILVNAAGVRAGDGVLQDSSPDDWEAMIDTNVRGLLNVTHAVLPTMVASGRGHVINIGSNGVRFPYRTGAVYLATKAAVNLISTGLRMDLKGTGVRVTHVVPGLVRTEISLVRFGGDAARAQAYYDGRPSLEPGEVAECIAWAAAMPEAVEIGEILVYPTGQM